MARRRVLALSREHPDGGYFEQKEKNEAQQRPRRDLNPQSSDPESDALSIRPRGLAISSRVAFLIKLVQAPAWCVLMRMLRAKKRAPCGWGFEQSYCAKLSTDGFRRTARWGLWLCVRVPGGRPGSSSPEGPLRISCPTCSRPTLGQELPTALSAPAFPPHNTAKRAVLCCSPVASDWTLTTVKAETASPVFPSPSAACRWDACAELCENPGLPLPRSSSPAYPMLGSLISDAVLPSPAGPALVPRGHKCARMKGQALFILIVASP